MKMPMAGRANNDLDQILDREEAAPIQRKPK